MVALRKPLDMYEFYNGIQNLLKNSGLDLRSLHNLAGSKSDDYFQVRKEDTCLRNFSPSAPPPYSITQYDKDKLEYHMWMIGLMSLSWLVVNIKKKQKMDIVTILYIILQKRKKDMHYVPSEVSFIENSMKIFFKH